MTGPTSIDDPPGLPAQLLGLLLLLPAAVLALTGLVTPTIRTALGSLQATDPDGQHYLTTTAYHQLGSYWPSLTEMLLFVAAPALVVGLLAVPMTRQVNDTHPASVRRAARILASVLIAGFAPLTLDVTLLAVLRVGYWQVNQPGPARALEMLTTLGITSGVVVTVVLSALRATPGRAPGLRPTLAVLATAAVAIGLQASTVPGLLSSSTHHSPLSEQRAALTEAPADQAWRRSAAMGTVTLGILALLGVLAALILLSARTTIQLQADRHQPPTTPNRTGQLAPVLAGAFLAALGIYCAIALLPALYATSHWAGPGLGQLVGSADHPNTTGTVLANTVLPPLTTAAVAVPVGYLGGLAIGALRPLGERSRWLLLPFAPWLFVTLGPFTTLIVGIGGDQPRLDPTQPLLASVPALFVFTLWCAGQRDHWLRARAARTRHAFLRTLVLPAIPLAVLLVTVSALLGSVDPLRAALTNPARTDGTAALLAMTYQIALPGHPAGPPGPALLLAAPLAPVAFLILAVLQLNYLDRLTIQVPAAQAPATQKEDQPS